MRIWRNDGLRRLATLLCALLLCAALPAVAEGARPAISERFDGWGIVRSGATVYRDPELTKPWTRVAGMVVRRCSLGSSCTAIARGGRIGYVKSSDVEALRTGVELYARRSTRAYQRPSRESRWVRVPQGAVVELLGVQGSCAEVRRDGVVAYMYVGHLAPVGRAVAV